MSRSIQKLTTQGVIALKEEGRYSDGGNLYLRIVAGNKRWIFRYSAGSRDGRKVREPSLGTFPLVSLADARQKAGKARKRLQEGKDPFEDRAPKPSAKTLGDCWDEFMELNMPSKRANTVASWKAGLKHGGRLKAVPVVDITQDVILAVLKPIWNSKPESAQILQGRLSKVMAFAKARGYRTGENPALWKGNLDAILPARGGLDRKHHKALPYKDVPRFMAALRSEAATPVTLCLEFMILTGARVSEACKAEWGEIDFQEKLWTLPSDRMKTALEHVVPLSNAAMAVIEGCRAWESGSKYIFPGRFPGTPVNRQTAHDAIRYRDEAGNTPHGFRSSLRTWAGNATPFPREVCEAALSHAVGDATERTYHREKPLEKLRLLLQTWADFLGGKPAENVVAFSKTG